MATVYHRDQAGAPALTYGNSSQIGFNAVKAILKACLVDGYTGRAAAGWELINEGPAFIVLRNGSHSGYVCFELVTSVMRVHLAETYTGMSGNIMTGAGVKSGTGSASSVPQAVNVGQVARSSDWVSWVLIADSNSFLLDVFGSASDVELGPNTLHYGGFVLSVGEDSDGNFISAGGHSGTQTSATQAPAYLSSSGGFTALKSPDTGLLVGPASIPLSIPGMPHSVPAQADAVFPLERISLLHVRWGSNQLAGRLRGIVAVPELQCLRWASYAAQSLGHPAPITTRTGNTPVDLGDGYHYFVRMGANDSPFWMITDNPEFW